MTNASQCGWCCPCYFGGLVALSVSAAALAISRVRRSRVRFTCHVQGGAAKQKGKAQKTVKTPIEIEIEIG